MDTSQMALVLGMIVAAAVFGYGLYMAADPAKAPMIVSMSTKVTRDVGIGMAIAGGVGLAAAGFGLYAGMMGSGEAPSGGGGGMGYLRGGGGVANYLSRFL